MKHVIIAGAFLLCIVVPSVTSADPVRVTTTTITTSGAFDCRGLSTCTGEGTNAVTIQSGGLFGTLTFHGSTSTFDVTNGNTPVTLGHFAFEADEGFVMPSHPANPNQPMLRFALRASQTSPVASSTTAQWQFGTSGPGMLSQQIGYDYFSLRLGPGFDGYTAIVYQLSPFPVSLGPSTTALTAEAGVVPEPATMILLGSGMAAAALARRRRRQSEA